VYASCIPDNFFQNIQCSRSLLFFWRLLSGTGCLQKQKTVRPSSSLKKNSPTEKKERAVKGMPNVAIQPGGNQFCCFFLREKFKRSFFLLAGSRRTNDESKISSLCLFLKVPVRLHALSERSSSLYRAIPGGQEYALSRPCDIRGIRL